VIRRATPAAVVELSPGTAVICCPAASARWRSSPTRKSSPASCADASPASSCRAPKPRSRCLTGPTAASSASITPSRSHSPVTAAIPAFGVSAPVRRADAHLPALPLPTAYPCHQIGASRLGTILTSQTNIIPGHSGTYRHLRSRVTVLITDSGQTKAKDLTSYTRRTSSDIIWPAIHPSLGSCRCSVPRPCDDSGRRYRVRDCPHVSQQRKLDVIRSERLRVTPA
jgi:hypothetical protein